MDITTLVRALTPLSAAFEVYGIPYHLTGSLALSVYVRTQVMQGIEVVADIKFSQVQSLVVQLEKIYDVTEIAIREAIEHRGSFTLIHHDTMQRSMYSYLPTVHTARSGRKRRNDIPWSRAADPFALLRPRIWYSCY